MTRTIFALFSDAASAEDAVAQLEQLPLPGEPLEPRVRAGAGWDARLSVATSDARHAVWDGIALGAASGALAALVVGGALGLGLGPLAAVLLGAGGGSLIGALGAGLSGLGVPDRALEGWRPALRRDHVLLSVQTDAQRARSVESVLRGAGALRVRRAAGLLAT